MGACDGCGTPESVRQDNHIHVELDFVPVWQSTPLDECPMTGDRIRRFVVMLSVSPYWSMAIKDKGIFYTLFGERLEGVTHWAEIPTIEERE